MNEEVFKAEDLIDEDIEVGEDSVESDFVLDLNEDVKKQLAKHEEKLNEIKEYCDDMEKRFHYLKEIITEKGIISDLTKAIEGIIDAIHAKLQVSDKIDSGDFIEILDTNIDKNLMFIIEEFLPAEYVKMLNELIIIKDDYDKEETELEE